MKRKGERTGVKTSFYLPAELIEKLRDVAWFERKPASHIVRELIEKYVGKRKVRRPRT